jgi:poly-beta-1,6-N-acetyl-D-glucosamine synthase
MDTVMYVLLDFAFFYPLVMSAVWMTGGLIYFVTREGWSHSRKEPPALADFPLVSLVVPCHNEGEQARETIAFLAAQAYPNIEIIAVNDGSRDNTGEELDALLALHPRLRVLHLASNQGKAMGLRAAALASNADYLLCIDGDALLDIHATRWMMSHLLADPRIGAVTGNPRIRNRTSMLGRLQVGEFSSIIGLIKRAQHVYGRIFTVSGVIAAFRKSALHDIGYWNTDMITEDIDVTWRLQMAGWKIEYEPNALCWILMPETLKGLWKQRLRWAQGGSEVLLRYGKTLLSWRHYRMWTVAGEYMTSLLWSYVMGLLIALWAIGMVIHIPPPFQVATMFPQWNGVVLGIMCMSQFALSTIIDRRYEARIGRNYYWMIWYPLAYWLLTTFTSMRGFPKAVLKKRGERAVWVSPDRGIR